MVGFTGWASARAAAAAASALILVACAPSTRLPAISDDAARIEARTQQDFALQSHDAKLQRLYRVAWTVAVANAALCGGRATGQAGFVLGSRLTLGRDFGSAPRRLWGVGDRIAILYVAPDSPADHAGLRRGDEILAVNDLVAPGLGGKADDVGKTTQMRWIETVAARQFTLGRPVGVTFRRAGEEDTIDLAPQIACDMRVTLAADDRLNALADGQGIHVFSGLMSFIQSDDELAFVLGHELAHNLLDHRAKQTVNAALGAAGDILVSGLLGRRTAAGQAAATGMYAQEFEVEADYLGAYLAARAGFDVGQGALFMRRMAAEHPAAIHLAGSDHPSTAKRFLAMKQTMAEIAAQAETQTQPGGLPIPHVSLPAR